MSAFEITSETGVVKGASMTQQFASGTVQSAQVIQISKSKTEAGDDVAAAAAVAAAKDPDAEGACGGAVVPHTGDVKIPLQLAFEQTQEADFEDTHIEAEAKIFLNINITNPRAENLEGTTITIQNQHVVNLNAEAIGDAMAIGNAELNAQIANKENAKLED